MSPGRFRAFQSGIKQSLPSVVKRHLCQTRQGRLTTMQRMDEDWTAA
jgi:hypothetical protein